MSFKTKKGTELKLLNLKGKSYLPVSERILWFREENPDWTIKTTIIHSDEQRSQAKAEIITPEGRLVASAHKSETLKGFADHMEKSETGAIGRALALCGYGTQFTDELEEGDRLADSPRPSNAYTTSAPEIPKSLGDYKPTFGKFKGTPLKNINKAELQHYIDYLNNFGKEQGKPVTGAGAEFIKIATALIGSSSSPTSLNDPDNIPF